MRTAPATNERARLRRRPYPPLPARPAFPPPGFDRGSGHYAAREALLAALSLEGAEAVPAFPLAAARRLPPTVLMSSCADTTVPWFESAEMFHRLVDAGVPAKHLVRAYR